MNWGGYTHNWKKMVLNIAIVGLVLQFAALDYMRLGK